MTSKTRRTLLSLFSLSLLFSCGTDDGIACYQCLLGDMVISSATMEFSQISDIRMNIPSSIDTIDKDYYTQFYVIGNDIDLKNFQKSYSVSEEEQKRYNTIPDNQILVAFISQVPQGYQAYKRDGIQSSAKDVDSVLLTDSFYYYRSNTDLFYCDIDVKEDETITSDYVFSFFFYISSSYLSQMKKENIRVLLNVNQDNTDTDQSLESSSVK